MHKPGRFVYLSAMVALLLAVTASAAWAAPSADPAPFPFDLQARRLTSLSVPSLAADDDIPGVALPASPLADALDYYGGDMYDVYQLPLTAGQTFYVELSNGTSSEFGLFLFGPQTQSVDTATETDLLDFSWFEGPGESLMFTADQTGTYYLAVFDYPPVTGAGPGTYTLTYGYPSIQPTLSGTYSKTTVSYGGSATVKGALLDEGGQPLAGRPVSLFYKRYGTEDWYWARDVSTNASGAYSFTLRPTAKTAYWVWSFGDFTLKDAGTDPKWVSAKAWVGNPGAPGTMYVNRAASVYAFLKPRHTAGTYPVRIYKYRYVNGAWKSYGYVTAKAANYSSYTKATASVKLPYRGRWRLRAYHADGAHVGAYSSGYDYVTVK